MTDYYTIDYVHGISSVDLRDYERQTQLDVMESWFYENYEDPAERTPYESAEGGYIWIWGGPYDAREELESEFGEVISDDVIDELVEKLERDCIEWAPTPSTDDYDNYLVDDIAEITEYYHNFSGAILDIEHLLMMSVDISIEQCFNRLLYVNVITALETYLSDAFINTVAMSPALMRRFIETTPEFQSEKVPLAEIYIALEGLERKARSYLIDVVWHHLDRAQKMYRATLGVEFPSDLGSLYRAILKRHDIVHRNGKTKDGEEIIILRDDIEAIKDAVEQFVKDVDQIVAQTRYNNAIDSDA